MYRNTSYIYNTARNFWRTKPGFPKGFWHSAQHLVSGFFIIFKVAPKFDQQPCTIVQGIIVQGIRFIMNLKLLQKPCTIVVPGSSWTISLSMLCEKPWTKLLQASVAKIILNVTF